MNMLNADDGIQVESAQQLGVYQPWQILPPAAPLHSTWAPAGHEGLVSSAEPDDWDGLFESMRCRLRAIVDGSRHPRWSARTQAWMLSLAQDCEGYLGRLQQALGHERTRCRQIESDAAQAQFALARLHAELARSRADELHARHQALHDGLTSLPNRRHFALSLAHAIEQASSGLHPSALALFYVDLDGFKSINDVHGHAAGDELLGIVAARLARALRTEDVVGRLGGDEFGCLLRGIHDRAPLRRLACKVFDSISASIKLGGLVVCVRPSIGIALFPGNGCSSDALLKAADMAMYQAKREQTGYAFAEDLAAPEV